MTIIDRYIVRQFLMTLVFALLALCTIYLIVTLMENLDEFLDQDVSGEVIVEYYVHLFPEMLKFITPIAVLLSTLFTIGRMSTSNEVTALKSGGMSLYRLMAPLIVICFALSFVQLYFNGWIVPDANRVKEDIEVYYLKKGSKGGSVYNLYYRDSPMRNVVMRYYNGKTKTGSDIAVEQYSSELEPRLEERTEAEKIFWDSTSSRWMLINGIERKYRDNTIISERFDTLVANIHISHDQLMQLKRSPEEMNLDEFRDHISLMAQGGKDVRKLLIDYYAEYAFPFANIIVIFFGVPFASVRRKGGIAVQIGAAMVISFLYLLFTNISKAVGYGSDVDPVLAGWSANLIFFFAGLIVLWRTRT